MHALTHVRTHAQDPKFRHKELRQTPLGVGFGNDSEGGHSSLVAALRGEVLRALAALVGSRAPSPAPLLHLAPLLSAARERTHTHTHTHARTHARARAAQTRLPGYPDINLVQLSPHKASGGGHSGHGSGIAWEQDWEAAGVLGHEQLLDMAVVPRPQAAALGQAAGAWRACG
jgi:hypothetical protein